MEPTFELETPDQEKARLAALEVKTSPAVQPTLIDGAKSAMPNLYPDHNTNPGSALLAATNDPNADPAKLAEITAAADKKYLVKPATIPLDDAHVKAKEMFDSNKKIEEGVINDKNYESERNNLKRSLDTIIDLKDIKSSVKSILESYAKDPNKYKQSLQVFNEALTMSISDKLKSSKTPEQDNEVAKAIKTFASRPDLFATLINPDGTEEDLASVKNTIRSRVESRPKEGVSEEEKKYEKESMFNDWKQSRINSHREAVSLLGLSEDDVYNMHLDRIKIDRYAGL